MSPAEKDGSELSVQGKQHPSFCSTADPEVRATNCCMGHGDAVRLLGFEIDRCGMEL